MLHTHLVFLVKKILDNAALARQPQIRFFVNRHYDEPKFSLLSMFLFYVMR